MAHYARIDDNDTVIEVIVIEHDQVITGQFGNIDKLIQTSYNTHGGVHISGGTPLRKNYAVAGYKYDRERDAFIPPQPFASWSLNEDSCLWEAPTLYPETTEMLIWNEETQSWG